jgi:hypothetical protein
LDPITTCGILSSLGYQVINSTSISTTLKAARTVSFYWHILQVPRVAPITQCGQHHRHPPTQSALVYLVVLPGFLRGVSVTRSGARRSDASTRYRGQRAFVQRSGFQRVVVPAGAEALGRVIEAVPQGRFKGAAELRLVLETVTLDKTATTSKQVRSAATRRAKGNAPRPSSATPPGVVP